MKETMDVQLASEESLSDESETLLYRQNGPLIQLGVDDEDINRSQLQNNNADDNDDEKELVDDEQTDRTDGTCYL
jgi:hypothetical protein